MWLYISGAVYLSILFVPRFLFVLGTVAEVLSPQVGGGYDSLCLIRVQVAYTKSVLSLHILSGV